MDQGQTKKQQWSIVYIGLNPRTAIALASRPDSIKLVSVAYIDIFNVFTLNPGNIVFKLLYKSLAQSSSKNYFCRLYLWRLTGFLTTSVFKKYKNYLNMLLTNNISVVNLDDSSSFKKLDKANIDLLVVDVWDILKKNILSLPSNGVLNIHPSRLPKNRGAVPTLWSLRNKDSESAVTYMLLDEKMDTGDIIAQHSFPIAEYDDWFTLEQKIAEIVNETLVNDIDSYLSGSISPKKQNEMEATYTPKYRTYALIDVYNETAQDIVNKIKLYPYIEPFVYVKLKFANLTLAIKNGTYVNYTANKCSVTLSGLHILMKTKNGTVSSRLFIDIGPISSLQLLHNIYLHRNTDNL